MKKNNKERIESVLPFYNNKFALKNFIDNNNGRIVKVHSISIIPSLNMPNVKDSEYHINVSYYYIEDSNDILGFLELSQFLNIFTQIKTP